MLARRFLVPSLFLIGCKPEPGEESENRAPTGATIEIRPANPLPGEALECAIVGEASDPDGDPVLYRYACSQGGVVSDRTTSVLPGDLVLGGQAWTCTITPSDG